MKTVTIFDTSCWPFDPVTLLSSPNGGSEMANNQLATELSKHVDVTVFHRKEKSPTETLRFPDSFGCWSVKGGAWAPLSVTEEPSCDTLIISRGTPNPEFIKRKRTIVSLTDAGPHKVADHDLLVGVSRWQLGHFPGGPKKVIPAMIDDAVYNQARTWHHHRYIYASARPKGLEKTLEAWRYLKQKEIIKPDSILRVTSAGWGGDSASLCAAYADAKVEWLGMKNPYQIRGEISVCGGLFYVNTYPETFCVIAALAELMGLRCHIYAPKIAGLADTINSPLLTDNWEAFEAGMAAGEADPVNPELYGRPNNFSCTEVIRQWLAVLCHER